MCGALESTSPLAQAVTNQAPLFLDAPESYAQFPQQPGTPLRVGALAAVPLVVDGAPIGVLGFSYPAPRPFDDDERTFLGALANQCAQALERTRLHDLELTARRRAEAADRRLCFLAEAGALAGSSLDPESLLTALAQLAAGRIADACLVHLVPEGGGAPRRLVVAHADDGTAELLREQGGRAAWPVAAQVIAAGHAVRLDLRRPAGGDRDWLGVHGFLSCLSAPLVGPRGSLGAITLLSADPAHPFDDEDLRLGQCLGRWAALAVDHARLSREPGAAGRHTPPPRLPARQVLPDDRG